MLVAATCLIALLVAWTAWHRHGVAVDYVAGTPGVWVADLTSADATSHTVGVLYLLATTAAGVALLVWLARVRANARLLGHAPDPAYRMFAVGGWFTVCLLAVATTFLHPDTSVAELSALATIHSVEAVVQCVAGALVIAVVTRAWSRGAVRRPRT